MVGFINQIRVATRTCMVITQTSKASMIRSRTSKTIQGVPPDKRSEIRVRCFQGIGGLQSEGKKLEREIRPTIHSSSEFSWMRESEAKIICEDHKLSFTFL